MSTCALIVVGVIAWAVPAAAQLAPPQPYPPMTEAPVSNVPAPHTAAEATSPWSWGVDVGFGFGIMLLSAPRFVFTEGAEFRSIDFNSTPVGPSVSLGLEGNHQFGDSWLLGIWARGTLIPRARSSDPGTGTGTYHYSWNMIGAAGIQARLAPRDWVLDLTAGAGIAGFQVGRAAPDSGTGPEVGAQDGLGFDTFLALGPRLGERGSVQFIPRLRMDFVWSQGSDANRVSWTNMALLPSAVLAILFE